MEPNVCTCIRRTYQPWIFDPFCNGDENHKRWGSHPENSPFDELAKEKLK